MTADHEHIAELLGAYALNAVDPDERTLVEDHLLTCPRCRAEVDDHHEVVALIANTGADAPEGVWSRIQANLVEEPPAMNITLPPGPDITVESVPDAPAPQVDDDLAPVRHLGRRAADRNRPVLFAAAAASVALLVGVAIGSLVGGDDSTPRSEIAATIDEAARDALNRPDATRVTLTSTTGDGTAEVVWTPDGQAYLVGTGLPALSGDRTYQLWGINENAVVSLGVLGNRPSVVAFPVDGDYAILAITEEVEGGVVASANDPVYVGEVA